MGNATHGVRSRRVIQRVGEQQHAAGGAVEPPTIDWERRLVGRALRVHGDVTLMLLDLLVVAGSLATVLLIRHGGNVPPQYWHGYLFFLPLATGYFLVAHQAAGLYSRIWRYAGIDEARRLLVAGAAVVVLMAATDLACGRPLGLSVVIGGGILATMVVGITRFHARLFAFHRGQRTSGLRLIMLGAGDTGVALLRQLKESPSMGIAPVAILDDDPDRWGRTCAGLRIEGPFSDLPRVARDADAHQVLLAVPNASPALIRRMADLAESADIALRVLPGPAEGLQEPYRVRDARAVAIDDLLGRQAIDTDTADLASQLRDRVVLVTGGGGSIGSEMVRQVAQLQPRTLLVLDHDETHLYDVLNDGHLGVRPTPLLADIRDRQRLHDLMVLHRPDVVVHAAAHKHVPMLEEHPLEACLTNVLGTRNLVAEASAIEVETFVLISTDKAAQATSVMGASKWLAEQIVLRVAHDEGRRWCAVRFGNVLGSRGSVVPLFTRQISAGGPVTVTDPRMTRFFMTIPEAVQLVLRAGSLSPAADLFLLDMGQPVKILELAKRMIRLAGYRPGEDIEIRITGRRPGEQLTEILTTSAEVTEPTTHESISRVLSSPPTRHDLDAALAEIASACEAGDQDLARRNLLSAVAFFRGSEPTAHSRRSQWSLSTTSGS
jgi:FlaA1/EpsC-like NDP-sugar epimerase